MSVISSDSADDGDDPHSTTALRCPYCERTFVRGEYRDLHLGIEHATKLTDDQQSAYESALEDEEEALRLFRYKAIGLLVLVYFGFLILYAFSL